MKINYEPLGKHLRPVDTRNTDMATDRLLGINIDKYFMPSVANIIGTDLSRYKLITKGVFACNPMHVGRDERLPVALYTEDTPAIVSPAYFMFEIADVSLLLPEYLMMWFRRAEFDRICWLKTDGSVRGGLSWDDLGRMELPVPSLDKQKAVIKAYQTITDRIALKRAINDNLEATAGAMFSQFYNSLPIDEVRPLSDVCCLASSKRIFADEYVDKGVPFYRGKEISQKRTGQALSEVMFISKERFDAIAKQFGFPQQGDILITAVGTVGNSYMVQDEVFYFKDGNIIWLKDFSSEGLNYFVFDYMQTVDFSNTLETICIGSTQTALTIVSLGRVQLRIPTPQCLNLYVNRSAKLRKEIQQNNAEIQHLSDLQGVLLANLAR
jgi:type I restriction enzyme S subunit